MSLQDKCEKKLDILNKRELERQLDLQKTVDEKTSTNAANEKTDYFQKAFNDKKQEIQDSLNASTLIDKKMLPEHFNGISDNILLLQKHVAASNIFLRTYDIKIYQQNILEMLAFAKDLELQLIPKKKFGFKNKPKETMKDDTKLLKIIKKDEIDTGIVLDEQFCGFKNESDKKLEICKETTLKKDVTLNNLNNCIVEVFGNPSTLHMSDLNNCKIFTGPVSTSIFAETCKNCVFVISCQQLRLHSSENIDIYLHVTSRAIMEDCKEIHLAPYNYSYDTIDEDYVASGLDRGINNWELPDDFNWLNVEKKSPNWCFIEENNRINNWNSVLDS